MLPAPTVGSVQLAIRVFDGHGSVPGAIHIFGGETQRRREPLFRQIDERGISDFVGAIAGWLFGALEVQTLGMASDSNQMIEILHLNHLALERLARSRKLLDPEITDGRCRGRKNATVHDVFTISRLISGAPFEDKLPLPPGCPELDWNFASGRKRGSTQPAASGAGAAMSLILGGLNLATHAHLVSAQRIRESGCISSILVAR